MRNRAPQSHEWPDEATERLRVLWAEGLGTREIGAELGVGKNAVIGKARRLGLAPRPSPLGVHPGQPLPPPRPRPVPLPSLYRPVVRQLEPQQRSSLAGRPPAPPATPPTPPEPPQAPQGSGGTCLWPTSNGRPWTFCGATVARSGSPYCRAHEAMAWVRRPSRSAEAAA